VIPASFDYVRAGSVEEAVAALVEHGDEAKVLAGGHSLLPLMKLRLATPSVLVDVGGISGLGYVRDEGDQVAIGALTRHHDLHHDPVAAREVPLLALVAGKIGDPQVRHRGTIGGSIAHADPASDLPAAVLALGGTMVATGPGGERRIPAAEFFTGFLESALAPDEVLTEIRVPKAPGPHAYQKFVRRAQDWAIVGSVVASTDSGVGVALVNVAPTPVRAEAVEGALASGTPAAEAAEHAADGLDPSSDINATGEFRRHLARVLTARALADAGL
jgi:aerobic carbon-monoxide dehydrogenase medium subunit